MFTTGKIIHIIDKSCKIALKYFEFENCHAVRFAYLFIYVSA